jgi:hypothetical protein
MVGRADTSVGPYRIVRVGRDVAVETLRRSVSTLGIGRADTLVGPYVGVFVGCCTMLVACPLEDGPAHSTSRHGMRISSAM